MTKCFVLDSSFKLGKFGKNDNFWLHTLSLVLK